MAQLVIDIPDGQAARVAAAFIATFGGDPQASPAQQRAFVKETLIRHIRHVVRSYEAAQASAAANAAAIAAVDAEITPS